MTFKASPAQQALSEPELGRLSAFLTSLRNPDAMDIDTLDGFFCALIAGPETVMPSEYLHIVWGGELPDENAFSSLEEANATPAAHHAPLQAIIAALQTEGLYVPLVGVPDERGVPGRPWARGFMRRIDLRGASWREILTREDEGQLITIPLIAGEIAPDWPAEPLTEEKRTEIVAWMAAGFARAYRYFTPHRRSAARTSTQEQTYRRSTPKVGRNDLYPCGSGKRPKHCCGSS